MIGNDWISASEPPTTPGRYLIYFPSESTSPMDALWTRDHRWICDGIDRTRAVTHYMHLPEPPKS